MVLRLNLVGPLLMGSIGVLGGCAFAPRPATVAPTIPVPASVGTETYRNVFQTQQGRCEAQRRSLQDFTARVGSRQTDAATWGIVFGALTTAGAGTSAAFSAWAADTGSTDDQNTASTVALVTGIAAAVLGVPTAITAYYAQAQGDQSESASMASSTITRAIEEASVLVTQTGASERRDGETDDVFDERQDRDLYAAAQALSNECVSAISASRLDVPTPLEPDPGQPPSDRVEPSSVALESFTEDALRRLGFSEEATPQPGYPSRFLDPAEVSPPVHVAPP